MGGHHIDPERELATINNLLNDAEGTLNKLLAKARDCKFISEIKYDPGTSKLFVTECRLPENLDASPFAYKESTRELDVPRGTNGKSIMNISCAKSVNENKVTITVDYDDMTSDKASFIVQGCKGPTGKPGANGKDLNQKPDDACRYPGAKFSSSSNGQLNSIASTAGTVRSTTGVAASVTGMAVGVTGLSITVNVSYTSLDGVFTSLCGWKGATRGFHADVSLRKCLAYALGMFLFPINIIVGVRQARAGVLKLDEKVFKTSTAFKVKN